MTYFRLLNFGGDPRTTQRLVRLAVNRVVYQDRRVSAIGYICNDPIAPAAVPEYFEDNPSPDEWGSYFTGVMDKDGNIYALKRNMAGNTEFSDMVIRDWRTTAKSVYHIYKGCADPESQPQWEDPIVLYMGILVEVLSWLHLTGSVAALSEIHAFIQSTFWEYMFTRRSESGTWIGEDWSVLPEWFKQYLAVFSEMFKNAIDLGSSAIAMA